MIPKRTAAAISPKPQSTIIDRPWLIVVVLLHVGFLGIPLYWRTSYTRTTRLLICLASIAYTVFALAVIAWGVWQISQLFTA
jgi:hypothetical protein